MIGSDQAAPPAFALIVMAGCFYVLVVSLLGLLGRGGRLVNAHWYQHRYIFVIGMLGGALGISWGMVQLIQHFS
jgi:hypothetical protein